MTTIESPRNPDQALQALAESIEKDPTLSIGMELECILWDPQKEEAVDVDTIFKQSLETGYPYETVTRDAGIASLEFTTRVGGHPKELITSLYTLRKMVKEKAPHLILRFTPRAPRSGEALAKKARYEAFFNALKQESPSGWERAREMTKWNSTQFHLGIDALTPQGLSILNILNDISPHASDAVVKKFNVVGDEGHLGIWQDYADSRRFSEHGRWFADAQSLKDFYAGIPRLIKIEKNATGDDQVLPDLKTPSQLGDSISEGTIWWFARPRTKLGTIEWRPFPSLQPSSALQLAKDVYALASYLRKILPKDRVVTREELPGIYAELANQSFSYLVPAKPPTADEWNAIARKRERGV